MSESEQYSSIHSLRQELIGEDISIDRSWYDQIGILISTSHACGVIEDFDKLKEQNEKLKDALDKIQNPILYLQKQAEASGASLDGLMAVALSKDCEWLKGIAEEALKSCES